MTVDFDRATRLDILGENTVRYSRMGIENILREYPHMPYFVATEASLWPTHREFHPAFFGSFDWHSCVEMHWTLIVMLKRYPDHEAAAEVRQTLNDLLTVDNIRAEILFFTNPNHGSMERPYGWGWLLTLGAELHGWDDADGQRWAEAVKPLADTLAAKFVTWLPKQTYPIRSGMHNNTAFGLLRSLDYAGILANTGDSSLEDAIYDAAKRWYLADTAYPAHYEPSGADFLSAALAEAELMSRVVDENVFPVWLEAFLPGLGDGEPTQLFTPAIATDHSDGQIAHLEGLNLSRAASFLTIASQLPGDDPRVSVLTQAAKTHADASLPHVVGGDYMTEHWLSAYATLLLTA